MADIPEQEIKLFYCYAREDKPLRDDLEKHLSWLKRRYQLINWHDRAILPGEDWEQAIDKHLNTAHLILLLISPDFMASDYCYSKEMQRALERHNAGTCRVIPILLRPTYWKDAPFSTLQVLPTDAKPITRWQDQDEAFQDTVTEISRIIEDLFTSSEAKKESSTSVRTKHDWVQEGLHLRIKGRYEEALASYEQAIRLDPNYYPAYNGKGYTLSKLKRYEEALAAHEQVIRLKPTEPYGYSGKGSVLSELKRYEEALAVYEQAIRLLPRAALLYREKGNVLEKLNRIQEAKQARKKADQLTYPWWKLLFRR